ncbi:UPF0053 protein, partial [Planctomyces bekefii]
LLSAEAWISLLTLTFLEVVLGIDNIIFIAILAGRLPEADRPKARKLGLAGAFVTRLGLLSLLSFLAHLTTPLFSVLGREVSAKDLVLLIGGLFLIVKATKEIHAKIEHAEQHELDLKKGQASLKAIIFQIMLIDMVFSIDSVITAVGMASHMSIMVIANVVALIIMLAVSGQITAIVDRHPSIKVLALSFLLMIGMVLVGEGSGFHIPKGYIYFAMGFSFFVESINIRTSNRKGR